MINRAYICDSCSYYFEVRQDMDAPLKKKCPECGKMELYQDLTGQYTFVYQDPKTLGHQAERNEQRMGKYLLEEKRKNDQKPKKNKSVPWYNKDGVDLTKSLSHLNTPEKQKKYIMEGK